MACKASEVLKGKKKVLSPNWPKQALKLIVLVACSTAVIFQLSECIMKLSYPPVSTRTELDMNGTISYPSITICRNPPYKAEVLKSIHREIHDQLWTYSKSLEITTRGGNSVPRGRFLFGKMHLVRIIKIRFPASHCPAELTLKKYNLGTDIRFTSEWKKFPFNTTTLSAFWQEATYSKKESINQYGLDRKPDHIEVISAMNFISGQCHTMQPLISTQEGGVMAGYSIALQHSNTVANHRPWNIYVHQSTDVFTENQFQTTGIQELLLLPVGDEMQVKISVQQLRRVDHPKSPCRDDENYSATRCEQQCRWNALSQSVGCSVPWMPGSNLPECNNYEDMNTIMVDYLKFRPNPVCNKLCQRACYASHFAAYIVNRNPVDMPKRFSQLWVYHSSKLVTSVREHWDYDLSRFVADAGGSLGFLLGVSVLSLVSLTAKIFRTIVTCGKVGTKDGIDLNDDMMIGEDTRSVSSISNGSIHSKVTLVAAHKY